MKFIIGSASKRKVSIADKVVRQLFQDKDIEVVGYPAISGVPDTPYDRETFDGAKNRAQDAKNHTTDADCYIGLESGLIERYGHIFEEAWCVVLLNEKEYFGYSSGLKVPDYILEKMERINMPHSAVMGMIEDEYKKTPNDTWGTYSGGIIAREISLEEALRNAFIQVVASEDSLYKK